VYLLPAVYALSGFPALSLEMLWFRLLQALLVANTYTFALLLAFYLAGIALGAELAVFWVRRASRPQRVFLSQTNRLWAAFYRIGPEEFFIVEDRTGMAG
jgi:hypothetical protein